MRTIETLVIQVTRNTEFWVYTDYLIILFGPTSLHNNEADAKFVNSELKVNEEQNRDTKIHRKKNAGKPNNIHIKMKASICAYPIKTGQWW